MLHQMKNLRHLLLGLSLGAGSVLFAQTTSTSETARGGRHGGPGGPGHGRGGHPIVRAIDADKDGELSTSELANAPTVLRTLDTSGDGIVSAEELHLVRPGRAAPADATKPEGAARTRPTAPFM